MLYYSYGSIPKYRKYVKVDLEVMKEARKGEEFLVILETTPIPMEKASELAEKLKAGLKEQFNCKLQYIAIKENEIVMYITGSPFTWAMLIAWLPTILALFGITIIGIGIWQAITSVPSWVYATIIAGLFMLYAAPHIVTAITGRRRAIRVE